MSTIVVLDLKIKNKNTWNIFFLLIFRNGNYGISGFNVLKDHLEFAAHVCVRKIVLRKKLGCYYTQ